MLTRPNYNLISILISLLIFVMMWKHQLTIKGREEKAIKKNTYLQNNLTYLEESKNQQRDDYERQLKVERSFKQEDKDSIIQLNGEISRLNMKVSLITDMEFRIEAQEKTITSLTIEKTDLGNERALLLREKGTKYELTAKLENENTNLKNDNAQLETKLREYTAGETLLKNELSAMKIKISDVEDKLRIAELKLQANMKSDKNQEMKLRK